MDSSRVRSFACSAVPAVSRRRSRVWGHMVGPRPRPCVLLRGLRPPVGCGGAPTRWSDGLARLAGVFLHQLARRGPERLRGLGRARISRMMGFGKASPQPASPRGCDSGR